VSIAILTPVVEEHKRAGHASPGSGATSIEASPSSPSAPTLNTTSLSSIAHAAPASVPDTQLDRLGHPTHLAAALTSHPPSHKGAPRSRSSSRHDSGRLSVHESTISHTSSARSSSGDDRFSRISSRAYEPGDRSNPPGSAVIATRLSPRGAEPGPRRKSTTRRSPSAGPTIPIRHSYRRSSDFTTARRHSPDQPPDSVYNLDPQRTIYNAYFTRRSRSLEPRSRTHLSLDSGIHSPVESVSTSTSGSTDVDPASDAESVTSLKDPDRYFESRQLWHGVAGEGRKGFYANVVDDYRMIGKDVTTATQSEERERERERERRKSLVRPEVTFQKIGSIGAENKVKIAGVDPLGVGIGTGQALVPSAEELWG
jgi:hypothetical protein